MRRDQEEQDRALLYARNHVFHTKQAIQDADNKIRDLHTAYTDKVEQNDIKDQTIDKLSTKLDNLFKENHDKQKLIQAIRKDKDDSKLKILKKTEEELDKARLDLANMKLKIPRFSQTPHLRDAQNEGASANVIREPQMKKFKLITDPEDKPLGPPQSDQVVFGNNPGRTFQLFRQSQQEFNIDDTDSIRQQDHSVTSGSSQDNVFIPNALPVHNPDPTRSTKYDI